MDETTTERFARLRDLAETGMGLGNAGFRRLLEKPRGVKMLPIAEDYLATLPDEERRRLECHLLVVTEGLEDGVASDVMSNVIFKRMDDEIRKWFAESRHRAESESDLAMTWEGR